ncbi:MAG: outer membrane protein assembly factor BamB [Cellvibrio sp.]|nr:outer membrane protein assembly factor BamB [Cellvibrio sp.]
MKLTSIRSLIALFLMVTLTLSGCSLFQKKTGTEPMELKSFKETAEIDKEWSRGIGSGQSKGFSILVPAIEDGKIYAVDFKGKLIAIDSKTGKKRWSKRVTSPKLSLWGWMKIYMNMEEMDPNWQISAGVGVFKDQLFLASYAGEVIALSSENGTELWRTQLPGEILAAPQSNGSIVAVQTLNGKLFALDAKTGVRRWFYDNPPPVLTLRGTSTPAVTESIVYAGFSNGRLMAFSADTGIIMWDQRIAMPKGRSELERMIDIHASPLMAGGLLYVGTYQGKISAVSGATGSALWAKDGSTAENMAVQGDKLFVSDTEGKLVCYSSASGEILWTNEKLLRRLLNAPQVVGDYVAVVDYKGYLHVMNTSDGELAARTRVGRKGARAPLLTDGERLYVFNNKGKLMAFTLKAD